jgi:membrane protease YdiL (CAAX protease family)
MTAPIEKDPVEKTPLPAKRWGFWATLGFSVIIATVYTVAQGFAIGVMVGVQSAGGSGINKEELAASIASNGFYLSVGIIISAWVGALVMGAVILLRKGISLKEYLAIKSLPFKVYARWLVFGVIFLFSWGVLSMALEQQGSAWMTETYQTAGYLPLLWIAVILFAPLVEELFFRGFLFEGLRDSWMGSTGAVLVTSIAWAAIHVQYEMFQIVMIGTLGVLLGIAKIKTRSLYIPIVMHSFNNLIAMVATALLLNS